MPDRMLAALDTLPCFTEPLKKALPFLMPLGGPNDTHVTLPPEKENRKIRFQEETKVTEIENRFFLNEFPEDDEEGSYEIEIVDDDGDADFYLEIVDGEVFYVFETEDDISVESEESQDLDSIAQSHHSESQQQSNKAGETLNSSMYNMSVQDMLAPDLDGLSEVEKDGTGPPLEISFSREADAATVESFNQSGHFADLDTLMEPSEAEETEAKTKPSTESPLGPLEDMMEVEQEPQPENVRIVSEETIELIEEEEASKPVQNASKKPSEIAANKKPLSDATMSSKKSSVPSPANKETSQSTKKPSWPNNAAISTESTTARLVLPRSESPMRSNNTDTDAPKSPPGSQTGSPQYSSPTPTSPSKAGKSILRCNPASPVKKPKKDRSKKKTTKTVSKSYVRADQLDGEHRVYTWAKPDWTTKTTQLRATGRAEKLREGKLEAPITFFPKKPVNAGLKEDDVDMEALVKKAMNAKSVSFFGHKKNLKVSLNGSKLREGQDISKPITKATIRVESAHINKVANPGVLKPTATGDQVRKGATLAAPVTFPKIKLDHTNRVANKNVLKNKGVAPATKQYEWSKPDWMTKPKLKTTAVGEAVKKGADLQGPITDAPHRRRKSFDSNDLTSSVESCSSNDGGQSDEAVVVPPPSSTTARRGQRRTVPQRTASMPSSNASQVSAISDDSSDGGREMSAAYERERRKKANEQKERQERLARMAQAWQNEDPDV